MTAEERYKNQWGENCSSIHLSNEQTGDSDIVAVWMLLWGSHIWLLSTILPSNGMKSKMLPQIACPIVCWHDLMFSITLFFYFMFCCRTTAILVYWRNWDIQCIYKTTEYIDSPCVLILILEVQPWLWHVVHLKQVVLWDHLSLHIFRHWNSTLQHASISVMSWK